MMEGIRQRKKEKDDNLDLEKENKVKDKKQESVPNYTAYIVIIGFLLFLKIIIVLNGRLPEGLTTADEENYPDRFIAERAESDLLKLVSLGPKVTGSYECEVLAPRLIRQELSAIAQTANPVHILHQDLQKPKGSFYMAFQPFGFQSIYENIQNIAIRLGPKPPSNHSVLINCHYDSVPDSPGASDNGLNCAVMLEVLRKISRSPQPLKHNLIFLFNGAEENVLQGAHAFITKHHWHKEIRMVINLDAAGAGGRAIVFQATPDHQWILKTYANVVPRPFANTCGQEIFDTGLIPSDTDFRIFRDYGRIPGIDMAHFENGHIYHTRLDNMDFITPGVFQHVGDNLLALAKALANASEIEDIDAARQPNARIVYYDILGIWMFVYSERTGFILNLIAVALSLYSAAALLRQRQSGTGIIMVVIKAQISAVLGIFVNLCIAWILDKTGSTMAWYGRPYFIIPMYVFTYIAVAILPWTQNQIGGAETALECFCGAQILTSLVLLFLTILGVKSAYVLMLLVIFPAIAGILLSSYKSAFMQLIATTAASLIGLINVLSFGLNAYLVLIPITGRAGSSKNPELIISGLTSLISFAVANSLVPLLLLVSNPKAVTKHLIFITLVTLSLIILTPFGFPYSDQPLSPALQRFYIYHTDNKLYNSNGSVINEKSGVFILPLDRNGIKYVRNNVPELAAAIPAHCHDGLLCQFPIYNSRLLNQAVSSFWLPLPPPQVFYPTQLELVESTLINPLLRRLKFSLRGPDHISLVISPRIGVVTGNWTLGHGMTAAEYQGRSYYIVYFSDGLVGDTTNFALDLIVESEQIGPWLDISVVGHYQHQKGTYTTEFNNLLKKFPAWTQATSWVATVQGYVF